MADTPDQQAALDQDQEQQATTTDKLVITRHRKTAEYFIEPLGNGIGLEMVRIPGGTFLMGSPEDELDRDDSEGPQHAVTVPTFFLAKFPVTQAQYVAVMGENPARFRDNGDNRPVEQVSWDDAVAFCQKLSEQTGRTYRLPSEAEWEYACRAGTTTPFHFGETITTELANYCGDDSLGFEANYGRGPKGLYREETTAVGSLANANAFGLYDMHGNVWEWCQDVWHSSYEGAPTDGSAWLEGGNQGLRVLRGGSWNSFPRLCRSANRDYVNPVARYGLYGFRVVCAAVRLS